MDNRCLNNGATRTIVRSLYMIAVILESCRSPTAGISDRRPEPLARNRPDVPSIWRYSAFDTHFEPWRRIIPVTLLEQSPGA